VLGDGKLLPKPRQVVAGEGMVFIALTMGLVFCRSAFNPDPPPARASAKPSGATLRSAPPALALRPHNLDGGQLFDADPGQRFGAV
jgi:hypothetical protein